MDAVDKGSGQETSRIPVAYLILGYNNNRDAITKMYRHAKSMLNWVTDAAMPEVGSKISWLLKVISEARGRGVKLRVITDITSDNVEYCKANISMADELRHLSGIKAIFGVSDFEFVAMVPSFGPRLERSIQFVQSDSESLVLHKQQTFDALWVRATPAQERFDELSGKSVHARADGKMTRRNVIDSLHVCLLCEKVFVYSFEIEEHKASTGHKDFRDFPLV